MRQKVRYHYEEKPCLGQAIGEVLMENVLVTIMHVLRVEKNIKMI